MDDERPVRNKYRLLKYGIGAISLFVIFLAGYFIAETKAGRPNLLSQLAGATNNLFSSTGDLFNKTFFGGHQKIIEEISLDERKDNQNSNTLIPETQRNFCAFNTNASPNHGKVILNEIAWMGSDDDPNAEWIEVKNISNKEVDISNWQLIDRDEQIKILVSDGTRISKQGFFVFGRKTKASLSVVPDHSYEGNLKNQEEGLRLFDQGCVLQDEVLADPNWSAGENSKGSKRTMERNITDLSWYTSSVSGGTPQKENPSQVASRPGSVSQSNDLSSSALTDNQPNGASSSSTVDDDLVVIPPPPPPPPPSGNVLISEILYNAEGSDTGKEFIELYNSTPNDVDLKDWSLKSSSNSLTKIGSLSEDFLIIKSGGFFLVGLNSYNGTPTADVKRSASLPNTATTISLFNASNNLIEEISYNNSVSEGQSFERVSWDSNQFAPQSNPSPKNFQ